MTVSCPSFSGRRIWGSSFPGTETQVFSGEKRRVFAFRKMKEAFEGTGEVEAWSWGCNSFPPHSLSLPGRSSELGSLQPLQE